jgi:Flp pilus assembly protein TadD
MAASTMLGIILTLQGKPDDARKHYEEALQIDPQAAVAANNLAWDYAEHGQNLDVALKLAQTAKSRLSKNADVSDTLGWVYYKKGLGSLAVSAFREAAEQAPSNPTIHYHLGLAYLLNGDQTQARKALQQALKLSPAFEGADDAKRTLASTKG